MNDDNDDATLADLDESVEEAQGDIAPSAPRPVSAPIPPRATTSGSTRPQIGNIAAGLSPSSHKKAEKTVVVDDAFDHDVAMRFAFVGAGQGGGRMADTFYRLGYRRVCAFNTTDMDFADLTPEMQKHSLDTGGASKDPKLARSSLATREEEVRDLLVRGWGSEFDCGLVCVSLGGGTGSGTAARVVEIARQYMKEKTGQERVGALVSLPTITEGYQVNRNAVSGLRDLMALDVSPLIIVDNARIQQLYRPPMSKFHNTANNTVAQLLHLFNQLAAVRGHITFDRSELAQLLDAGIVVMGAADIPKPESPTDISTAIRDELSNNVLAAVDLRTGKKGACLFVASQALLDELPLDYFEAGFSQLDRTLGSAEGHKTEETVVHRGLYTGAEEGLQCYTMISQLSLPEERIAAMAKVGGILNGDDGDAGSRLADYFSV
jgi:cell division GTPase FtsZ